MSLAIQAIPRALLSGRRFPAKGLSFGIRESFTFSIFVRLHSSTDISSFRFSWFRAICSWISLAENIWDCQIMVGLASWRPISQ